MKASELREMSTSDIESKISDMSVELFKYRMQMATNQLEKYHKIKELKRDIARAKTVIGEMKRADQ